MMATAAPGEGGGRNTTGTRTGHGKMLGTGGVVLTLGQFAIAWRRTNEGLWLGLPIVSQTSPLHRSHVILAPDEAAAALGETVKPRSRVLVLTGQPLLIPSDATRIGEAGIGVLIRIRQTMIRVRQAIASEGIEDAGT